jgi:hypothetical protein
MAFRTSSTGILVKRLTTSKLTMVSRVYKLTDLSNCKKLLEFFSEDSDFLARGRGILLRKPARA